MSFGSGAAAHLSLSLSLSRIVSLAATQFHANEEFRMIHPFFASLGRASRLGCVSRLCVCDVTECQSGAAASFIYLSALSIRIDFFFRTSLTTSTTGDRRWRVFSFSIVLHIAWHFGLI